MYSINNLSYGTKRNFYEGGRLRGANAAFFHANSPFEETANTSRDVMRARARWLHENNGIVAGIDHSLTVNVLGTGLKFQSKTGDENLDKKIENLWREFCKPQNCDITRRQHFNDIQRLVFGQRMMDGEILIIKKKTNDKKHPLKIQLIEADRFDTLGQEIANNDLWVEGIEVDRYGAPQKYLIRNSAFETVKLPYTDVIHYYKLTNRATQYRGISEYKQIIIDLRNLAGFNSTVLEAARARASLAYAIEVEGIKAAQGFTKGREYDPIEEINGAIVYYLNRGEKLHQLDSSKAYNEYDSFVKTAIRLIAVGRQVSYELAFRDYSQVNFSSARASVIQDHKKFNEEQWHIATYFLNPFFESWFEANVLAGNIPISPSLFFKEKEKFIQPRWIAPVREWVDPLKDIRAVEKELELGISTLQEVLAKRGKDLEEVIAQRKRENEMLKEAGIIQEEEK